MAGNTGNIPLSRINPRYLHANSTSHTWAFSAIAELIDNAYDPDVSASHLWIDLTQIKGLDCLIFMDDGAGLTYDTMLKMMSFGFTDKKTIRGHAPVGQYGNGFKSGSMRLGKDVLVFSKSRDTMSVGLLSQTYLAAIQAEHILVPIVIFRQDGDKLSVVPGHEDSLKAILEYSLFNTEEELQRELAAISPGGSTGTRILIWNLRSPKGKLEFDLETERYDVQVPREDSGDSNNSQGPRKDVQPEFTYSLRAYCSILYLKPRMQIIIRGERIQTQLVSKSLAHTRKDRYTPQFLGKRKPIPITFGYDPGNKNSGIMLYYKKRLIKAYERVGCQCRSVPKGVGIIGIIECDFLKPTHNKQDFDDTDEYRKVKRVLGEKLEEYWNEMHHLRQKRDPRCSQEIEGTEKSPDQLWVQCYSCQKWRKLPDGIDASELPEEWLCYKNPDPKFRSCTVDEEFEDSEDEQPYTKTYKLEKKQQQERNKQQTAEDGASTPSTAATPSSPGDSGSELPQEGTSSPPRSRAGNSRSGVRHREPSAHATPRSKRSLFPTPRSTRAKRAKADGDWSSLWTDAEEFLAYVAPDDQIMDDAGAPAVQTEVAAPISVQERDQQLSDGAVPEEPMEPSTRATAADTASAVQQSVSVDTQTERVAQLKEEPSEDQPNCLEQTQRQREAANGGERPLLELDQCRQQLEEAKQERDLNRSQMEAANQERDQYRTQLEAANQERDQYRDQANVFHQERDQCRGQVEQLRRERDQYKEQLEALNSERNHSGDQVEIAIREREQYTTKVNQLKQELLQMRAGQVEPEPRDQVSTGEDDLTTQWDSIFKDLSRFKDEMDQLRIKCEEQRRELEEGLRGAGSSIISPRPAQSTGAGPSQPGSSEAERLKGLRLSVSRVLLMLMPEMDLSQVNYESTVIEEMLDQYLEDVCRSGAE